MRWSAVRKSNVRRRSEDGGGGTGERSHKNWTKDGLRFTEDPDRLGLLGCRFGATRMMKMAGDQETGGRRGCAPSRVDVGVSASR